MIISDERSSYDAGDAGARQLPSSRGRPTPPKLVVVAVDVADTVSAAGGFIFDSVRAGWMVEVYLETVMLTALASFHTNLAEPELTQRLPDLPPPEDVPLLQHWVHQVPPGMRTKAQTWIDEPPAVEMRIAEPTNFLGGRQTPGPRSHWMRLPREIDDDPALHSAMLAYASDYLMLDMALRNHPEPIDYASVAAVSLDHAIWLHRPVRFDEWYLYTQEIGAIVGHRAMIRGTIREAAGRVVASTAQEVLIRSIKK